MEEVNIHQAKTHLARLLRKVAAGEEVVISRAGKPVARLVPVAEPPRPRELGKYSGQIWIADDFDAPMPDDFLDEFERPL